MPDFESYEAQEEFRTKTPIAMKWVEAVLKAKGIDSSAIQWRSIGPDVLTLTVEFPKLDREYTRDMGRSLLLGIADDRPGARENVLSKFPDWLHG